MNHLNTKTLNLSFIVLFFIALSTLSCVKNKMECSDYVLNFSYSLSYSKDSSYVSVEFSNASSNIPSDANIYWNINGDEDAYRTNKSCMFLKNGDFSIIMEFIHDGTICSVSKEFTITGIK